MDFLIGTLCSFYILRNLIILATIIRKGTSKLCNAPGEAVQCQDTLDDLCEHFSQLSIQPRKCVEAPASLDRIPYTLPSAFLASAPRKPRLRGCSRRTRQRELRRGALLSLPPRPPLAPNTVSWPVGSMGRVVRIPRLVHYRRLCLNEGNRVVFAWLRSRQT